MSFKMSKFAERVLAMLLAVIMVLAMFPVSAMQTSAAVTEDISVEVTGIEGGETVQKVTLSIGDQSVETDGTASFTAVSFSEAFSALSGAQSLQCRVITDQASYIGTIEVPDIANPNTQLSCAVAKETTEPAVTHTVSVDAANADVKINGVAKEQADIAEGRDAKILVTPTVGYYITEITGVENPIVPEKGQAYEVTVPVSTEDISVKVTLSNLYTVQLAGDVPTGAEVSFGGTSLKDGQKNVPYKTTEQLQVTCPEEYEITSVTVIGTDDQPAFRSENDKYGYTTDLTITADTEITVTYAKLYTVTVTYDSSKGDVNTDPAGAKDAGRITAKVKNGQMTITAEPKHNFMVSKAVINSAEQSDLPTAGAVYTKEITVENDNVTVEITFAKIQHTVTVSVNGANGKIWLGNVEGTMSQSVDQEGSIVLHVNPDDGYVIKDISSGCKLKQESTETDQYTCTLTNVKGSKNIQVSFEKASAEKVKLESLFPQNSYIKKSGNTYYVGKSGDVSLSWPTLHIDSGCPIAFMQGGTLKSGDILTAVGADTADVSAVYVLKKTLTEGYYAWHQVNDSAFTLKRDKEVPAITFAGKETAGTVYLSKGKTDTAIASVTENVGLKSARYRINSESWKDFPLEEGSTEAVLTISNSKLKSCTLTIEVMDLAGNKLTTEPINVQFSSGTPVITAELAGTGTVVSGGTNTFYTQGTGSEEKHQILTYRLTDDLADKDTMIAAIKNAVTPSENIIVQESHGSYTVSGPQSTYNLAPEIVYESKDGEKVNLPLPVYQEKNIHTIVADWTAPVIQKAEVVGASVSQTVASVLTLGLYKAPVKLVVQVKDTQSPVQSVIYTMTGVDGSPFTFNVTPDMRQSDSTYQVIIEDIAKKDYDGDITVSAKDAAGCTSNPTDLKDIQVDVEAPKVEVVFDGTPIGDTNVYAADRTATIKVTDMNYNPLKEGAITLEIMKDGQTEGAPTAQYAVAEGVYKVQFAEEGAYSLKVVSCKDQFDHETTDADVVYGTNDNHAGFVIDKSAPNISLTYDSLPTISKNHVARFGQLVTATVHIQDVAFNPDSFQMKVEKWNNNRFSDETDKYVAQWSNESNWKKSGNGYDCTVSFREKGKFKLNILSYQDKAGHDMSKPNYGLVPSMNSANVFRIETDGPALDELEIKIGSESIVSKNPEIQYDRFFKEKQIVQLNYLTTDENAEGATLYYAKVEPGHKIEDTEWLNCSDLVNNQIIVDVGEQFAVYFKVENAFGHSTTVHSHGLTVDNTAPLPQAVQYEQSLKDIVLEGITFGIYKAKTSVTFPVTDNCAGLDYISYFYGDSTEEAGRIEFDGQRDVHAKLDVEPQFRNTISYTAVDRAGNSASIKTDGRVVIVDTLAPKLSAEYTSDSERKNDKYYALPVTVTIVVDEQNFFQQSADQIPAVQDNKNIVIPNLQYKLSRDGKYRADLPICNVDGAYSYTVNYTDQAGYDAESLNVPELIVDQQAPDMQVTYSGTGNEARTGTITVHEANFAADGSGAEFKVTATDIDGQPIDGFTTPVLAWRNSGTDTWKAEFTLDQDANYHVTVDCVDLAGNPAQHHENSFTVDTTAPRQEDVDIEIVEDDPGEVILNALTFGLFRKTIKVTLSAKDISGIQSFTYNIGGGDKTVAAADGMSQNGVSGSYTFKIPAPFNGAIVYCATNNAGLTSERESTKDLTVDTTNPVISISYDNNDVENSKYFRAVRTATVDITEHNFRADLVTIEATKNGAPYPLPNLQWTADGDKHTAQIPFASDGEYTLKVSCKDTVEHTNDPVTYADGTKAPEEFVIDTKETADITMKVAGQSVMGGSSVAFECFYQKPIAVKATAKFGISGQKSVQYQKVAAVSDFQENNNWIDYNPDTGVVVQPNEKFVLYIRAEDYAGHVTIVNSKGIVVDNKAPEGETKAPDIDILPADPSSNNLYNGDVILNIKALDPRVNGAISGLKKISYRIYANDIGAEETGVLYDTAVETAAEGPQQDSDHLTESFTGTLPIDSKKFNSNHVFVEITAEDNSGNIRTTTTAKDFLQIDVTNPKVQVKIDGKTPMNGQYFTDSRKATITVTERNFDLNKLGITIMNADGKAPEITWKEPTAGTGNGDDTQYVGTVKFADDGAYTFEIADYTDEAGNSCKADFGKSEAPNSFTVDNKNPEITVSYSDNGTNGNHHNLAQTATITVTEHNFDETATTIQVFKNGSLDPELGKNLTWTQEGDVWKAEIKLDKDAKYTVKAETADKSGNSASIEDSLCVDQTPPEKLKIRYKETDSVKDVILKVLTMGYYKNPVTVTLMAEDVTSGLESLTYSYTVEDGVSEINKGKANVEIPLNGEKSVEKTFEIPPQFRGFVSFTAKDKAGNETFFSDKENNTIVVDNKKPVIKVTFESKDAVNGFYYNQDRTARISVKEANFYAEDVKVTVNKNGVADASFTEDLQWNPDPEGAKDTYCTSISFTQDADYDLEVSYQDRSKNDASIAKYQKSFVLDKTRPVIRVTYDNNEFAHDADKYSAPRTATILVTEHNFDQSQVKVNVKRNGQEDSSLTDQLNWNHDGDKHTARIAFTDDAKYSFAISYRDQAGNDNQGVDYGESKFPNAFLIDQQAPTDLTMTIDGTSVLGGSSITFDRFYRKAVAVKLNADSGLSGQYSLTWQKVARVADYKPNGTWTAYNPATGVIVKPDEQFVLYFRAEDRSGNVTIVNSTGIVVDDTAPVGQQNAPEIDILPEKPNANGLHNGSVPVSLKVLDPTSSAKVGNCSGLNKITYRIYTSDTSAAVSGTLMDLSTGKTSGAKFNTERLATSWTGSITVDADKFNSNHVFVEVTATDNSGNTRTTTTADGLIRIDNTAPVVNIHYNNNTPDSSTYFKADRTATISVTERNFKAEDVKITLTNTDGAIPALSSWTKTAGSGNGDNTVWTATIDYNADGDYTFDLTYTDAAGNAASAVSYGSSVAPREFTIDKTVPVISVAYSNNAAVNGNYYSSGRTATVTITEHNLDPNGADRDRIQVSIGATYDGTAVTAPTLSSWQTSGDRHTATVTYGEDADYSFKIAVKDKAGNNAAEFEEQKFTVDTTEPKLEISGIRNHSANKGNIAPVITYSDVNYEASQVKITLTGANRKDVKLEGIYTDIHNGRVFTFNNLPAVKENDDIYTLTATLTDKAGNETTDSVTFSANRFGSTYSMNKQTEALNGSYVKESGDVVFTEVNTDALKNIRVTLFKNNETITLEKDEDYTVKVEGGNGQWYRYTYTVKAANFLDDGVYRLTVHSEDAAGNVAENNLDTKQMEVNFGVDNTAPNIVVTNLESGKTYALDHMTVSMSADDNLVLASAAIYLDNYDEPAKIWTAEEIADVIEKGGEFLFDVSGDSRSSHNMKVVFTDAAGNEQVEEITDFYVTTDRMVRFVNNKPLFYGTIGGSLALICFVVALVVLRKRGIVLFAKRNNHRR